MRQADAVAGGWRSSPQYGLPSSAVVGIVRANGTALRFGLAACGDLSDVGDNGLFLTLLRLGRLIEKVTLGFTSGRSHR